MPITGKLEKATLTEMWPGGANNALTIKGQNGPEKVVTVQFNPQTLKLSFSNQTAGGNQSGGSATQFAGQGTTKLSLELWFDVTLPSPGGADPGGDVRNLTKEVAFFMTPQELKDGSGVAPPGVQFQWGTFLFKGTVDSMEETLDLFSEDGKPLRAGVTLSLSKQDLIFDFQKRDPAPEAPGAGGGPAAGTQPLSMAKSGDTVQGLAAAGGVSDWKAVAIANGIENPRRMAPGALLNVSGSLSGSGAASLGLTGGTAATLGASAGVSIGGGVSAAGSASASASASAAASAAIRVAGTGSGSSGLSASSSLRFTGPLGPSR